MIILGSILVIPIVFVLYGLIFAEKGFFEGTIQSLFGTWEKILTILFCVCCNSGVVFGLEAIHQDSVPFQGIFTTSCVFLALASIILPLSIFCHVCRIVAS
jgi:succinate dehydrogenase hydrophobic anchor subunit